MPSVLIIIGVVALLVMIFLLKKISGIVKLLLVIVVLALGFASVILFVPSNPLSIWVAENVASKITIDADGKYTNEEVIFTYEFNPSAESNNEKSEDDNLLTSSLRDVTGAMSKFLVDRIVAIASDYIEKKEEYTLSFSDAYLIMTPGDVSMKIEIIKGVLPEE